MRISLPRVLACVLTALAVLSGCSFSHGTPNAPIQLSSATLTYNGQPVTGNQISAGPPGGVASVTGGGGPPYIFSIADSSIAGIALVPGTNARRAVARAGAPMSLVSNQGYVILTTLADGATTMTVSQPSGRILFVVAINVSGVTPSVTPTPAPGAVVPSATSVAFTAAGQTQIITVSQGGNAAFTMQSSNPGVASVPASTNSGTFAITAVNAGSATITITGAGGITATISVGVTITGGTIQ